MIAPDSIPHCHLPTSQREDSLHQLFYIQVCGIHKEPTTAWWSQEDWVSSCQVLTTTVLLWLGPIIVHWRLKLFSLKKHMGLMRLDMLHISIFLCQKRATLWCRMIFFKLKCIFWKQRTIPLQWIFSTQCEFVFYMFGVIKNIHYFVLFWTEKKNAFFISSKTSLSQWNEIWVNCNIF